ncbi:uncharacterized protein LOC111541669 [Piliocolobus tephrosceles]|uniref:uncharacterized protein LOC111541669 n=1 Tax=Piliocolobus tephrosceles TaxID=591936 RepID=UPI000C2AFE88|nr:uncharacterized protein LOC111541669 [Piliocolobus tephrosceles]
MLTEKERWLLPGMGKGGDKQKNFCSKSHGPQATHLPAPQLQTQTPKPHTFRNKSYSSAQSGSTRLDLPTRPAWPLRLQLVTLDGRPHFLLCLSLISYVSPLLLCLSLISYVSPLLTLPSLPYRGRRPTGPRSLLPLGLGKRGPVVAQSRGSWGILDWPSHTLRRSRFCWTPGENYGSGSHQLPLPCPGARIPLPSHRQTGSRKAEVAAFASRPQTTRTSSRALGSLGAGFRLRHCCA